MKQQKLPFINATACADAHCELPRPRAPFLGFFLVGEWSAIASVCLKLDNRDILRVDDTVDPDTGERVSAMSQLQAMDRAHGRQFPEGPFIDIGQYGTDLSKVQSAVVWVRLNRAARDNLLKLIAVWSDAPC